MSDGTPKLQLCDFKTHLFVDDQDDDERTSGQVLQFFFLCPELEERNNKTWVKVDGARDAASVPVGPHESYVWCGSPRQVEDVNISQFTRSTRCRILDQQRIQACTEDGRTTALLNNAVVSDEPRDATHGVCHVGACANLHREANADFKVDANFNRTRNS